MTGDRRKKVFALSPVIVFVVQNLGDIQKIGSAALYFSGKL
jgi:hypothetical protein